MCAGHVDVQSSVDSPVSLTSKSFERAGSERIIVRVLCGYSSRDDHERRRGARRPEANRFEPVNSGGW